MTTKNYAKFVSILAFVIFMFGCSQFNMEVTPTETALPTATLTETPTLTPAPTLPPVYSYFPAISAANTTKVVNINNYRSGVNSLAFSPNGKYLAATLDNGVGIFWDISNAKGWNEWVDAPKDVFVSKGQVSFNQDGSILATGGTLLEFPSKKVIQELQGTAVFNPVNQTLAEFDWNNISIRNLSENQLVLNLKKDSPGIINIAFSPDGNLLGEALDWGRGEGVNVWKISDHALLYSFPPVEHHHPAHFNMFAYAFFAFSPDNQYIVTGTKDFLYKIRIWNLQTGNLVQDLDVYAQCVAFTQDAKVIILVSDNRITFRTFPDGDAISQLEVPYYMSLSDGVTTCTTSKDGKLLAIGDYNGNVSIWGVPAYAP